MAIQEFRATTIVPAALRADGAGFVAGGQFIVRVRFDDADAGRYEYRQYIKGSAFVTHGSFSGAPSFATWTATGTPHNAANDFLIPGGLKTTFAEDGEVRSGRIERFGYRNTSFGGGSLRQGIEDRYLPSQATGAEYRSRDTWGLRGLSRPRGLRVKIDIVYKGAVIDTLEGNRVVDTRHWGVHIDDIIV